MLGISCEVWFGAGPLRRAHVPRKTDDERQGLQLGAMAKEHEALSWESSGIVNERREELAWLAKESAPYAGQWVALDGSRLVAHGPKLAEVSSAARAAGVEEPFFASVPDDHDSPLAGW